MSTPTTAEGGLPLHFLPFIDMTTLSQSELRSLSLFSSSFHLQDGAVRPSIDPSSFNQSAGSRRQTYSRLPSHHHHRHGLAALLPKTQNPISNTTTTDTDHLENRTIIKFLKQFLSSHPQFNQLDLVDFDTFTHLNNAINYTSNHSLVVVNDGVNCTGERKKRKRGRKPKKAAKVMGEEEREREVVNKNEVVVDLLGLGSLEGDPYKEELRRRSGGMDKEEELLEFLRGLGGKWCSRRRKRKIVDANEFGDALPVGWKLLLGLKRKDSHAWVYCRRYIRLIIFVIWVFEAFGSSSSFAFLKIL